MFALIQLASPPNRLTRRPHFHRDLRERQHVERNCRSSLFSQAFPPTIVASVGRGRRRPPAKTVV